MDLASQPMDFWVLTAQLMEHWVLLLMFLILVSSLAGVPDTGLGIQNLLHDDASLIEQYVVKERLGWAPFLNSPAIFVQCFSTVLAVLIWSFLYTLTFRYGEPPAGDVMANLKPSILPHVLITSAITLFFGVVSVSDAVGKMQRFEWLRCLIGVALGLGIGWAILTVAGAVYPHFTDMPNLAPTLAVGVPALIVVTGLQLYTRLITGVTMITLFCLIVLIYAGVNLVPEKFHPLIFIAVIVAIVAGTGIVALISGKAAPLKFQIPGIVDGVGKDHYEAPLDLSFYAAAGSKDAPASNSKIDPIVALEAWRDRVAKPREKPKLVLVATSGGAYRASFWTALVLDALAERDHEGGPLEGICSNIRLITGASGGMVGAGYFTAMMSEGAKPGEPLGDRMLADIQKVQSAHSDIPFPYKSRFPVAGDSLSPVAQRLVQRDIPNLFVPGKQLIDRGTVLEDQWLTLDTSFGQIRNEEAKGMRPSIVFSPMLVETGQPLLITNLDMAGIGFDRADETVEFFDWFPASRDTFKLKTAVRLNAAFPYVAPASALPTSPYRRVVDAGYYDNYGVDVAVGYLSQPRIRDWVIENTSGAMVIQIRAFPFTAPGQQQPGRLAQALQFATTPLEGFGAARGSTMKFRNSQSLRQVENLYRLKNRPDFVQSVVLEVDSSTSLSWYMPTKELDDLKHRGGLTEAGGHAENAAALHHLETFWANKKPVA